MRPDAVATTECPQCRTPIPGDADGDGLCPRCLLAGVIAAADPAPGLSRAYLARLFPELELLELLGTNMATVYRARHVVLDRPVVLKAFDAASFGSGEERQRFRREAATLAGLRHPNVVAVHDASRTDGIDYFVMDYVAGDNLRVAAGRGWGPAGRARTVCGWVGTLCEAVQYVHDRGVVHRDIKPENVIVRGRTGVPVLIDFGLAKGRPGAAGGPELTRAEQGMGSGYYTAPEQVRDAASVDHRADLFSLGVVLFELWTGEPPVGQLPDPAGLTDPVDRAICRVARKAMAQLPADRHPTAADLRLELEQIVAQLQPLDLPAAGRTTRRRPPRLTVAAVVASSMAVAGYFAYRSTARTEGGADGSPPTAVTSPTVQPTRIQSVLADLQDKDWQVRRAAVKRFGELERDERIIFRYALEEVLGKKLDPKLFRTLVPDRDKETYRDDIESYMQSGVYRSQLIECYDLLVCHSSYHEEKARYECANNLRQLGPLSQSYDGRLLILPPGSLPGDPAQPSGPNWSLLLLEDLEKAFIDDTKLVPVK